MNTSRKAYSLMIMAAMFEGMGRQGYDNGKSNLTPEKIDVTPKNKPLPKGCKKYEFEYMGELFSCISLNEKSALKKFNNWIDKRNKKP